MNGLRLTQQVAEAFLPNPPAVLGVAVSGGGDSMALLHLMHGLCTLHGARLRAVTVDHGMRPEAKTEADHVRAYCATLGVQHEVLSWEGWDGQGNLQAAARDARYRLIAGWAADHGIDTVALGHTADDQAETVLMRLARRAGVDGLSGIPGRLVREGITWVRPILRATREELRGYLRAQHIRWIEDASNEDTRFERVRARQALAQLAEIGIDAEALSVVATQMADARKALNWQAFLAAQDIARIDAGAVVFSDRQLRILPEEIQRRLLVQAIGWISGGLYPPRRAAVSNLMRELRKGQAGTADGVHARRVGGHIWVFREFSAVEGEQTSPLQLWDGRWRVNPPDGLQDLNGLSLRALGPAGLEQCPDWRLSGRPRAMLLSTPAVWKGDQLLAAPLVELGQTWHAELDSGEETFFAALLTH